MADDISRLRILHWSHRQAHLRTTRLLRLSQVSLLCLVSVLTLSIGPWVNVAVGSTALCILCLQIFSSLNQRCMSYFANSVYLGRHLEHQVTGLPSVAIRFGAYLPAPSVEDVSLASEVVMGGDSTSPAL